MPPLRSEQGIVVVDRRLLCICSSRSYGFGRSPVTNLFLSAFSPSLRIPSLLLHSHPPHPQHGPPQRLVTAQLHPSAPPYFYLNPPTRQPRRVSTLPSSTATGGCNGGGGEGGDDGGSSDTAGAAVAATSSGASPAASAAIAVALSPALSVSSKTTATSLPPTAQTSAPAGSSLPAYSCPPPAPPPSTTEACVPSTATPVASSATSLAPTTTPLLTASTPLLSTATSSSAPSPTLHRRAP